MQISARWSSAEGWCSTPRRTQYTDWGGKGQMGGYEEVACAHAERHERRPQCLSPPPHGRFLSGSLLAKHRCPSPQLALRPAPPPAAGLGRLPQKVIGHPWQGNYLQSTPSVAQYSTPYILLNLTLTGNQPPAVNTMTSGLCNLLLYESSSSNMHNI